MRYNWNSEDVEDHGGVGAVIKNSKGQILMLDHVKLGLWTIPIGKVKKGQTHLQALIEEVYEETGLTVTSATQKLRKKFTYTRNGKNVNIDTIIYEATTTGTAINLEPQKHRDLKWMTLAKIKKLPKLGDALKAYLKRI